MDSKSRALYEQWKRDSQRKRAARERLIRRVLAILAIFAIVAFIFAMLIMVNYATAAPLTEPKIEKHEDPLDQYSPKKSVTLDVLSARCESTGGHWFVDEEPEGIPTGKIVGCLWLVPKSMK